ncbi:hypothetical protein Tel_05260 [Candidatus Tenderia electrophaga]|jgi:hypothetical protein|uniref:Uncharacterized protein n=1 Tax=Candidatus Tenderia electrophaga TaxID=1748243 RepID=A0A0S2TBU2_9GAMM|nr:hypothetical protein Tel_05260 [Candidatus Tenderia electrophaga]
MALKIYETTDGRIEYRHDSTAWGRLWVVIGFVFFGVLVYDLTIGSRGDQRAVGLIGAAFTCFGIGLLLLERSHLTVNTSARRIEWLRRHGLRLRQGQLSFDKIGDVYAHSPVGDEGTPSRRVVLKLKDGKELPLTAAFLVDPDDAQLLFAQRLRILLVNGDKATQDASPDVIDDNVRALVRAGHEIDAIRLLRESRKVDLTTARQHVQEIKRDG